MLGLRSRLQAFPASIPAKHSRIFCRRRIDGSSTFFRRNRRCLHVLSSAQAGSWDGSGESESDINKSPAELSLEMSQIKRRLAFAEEELQEEKQRQQALAPYLVTAPKRGIIGNSRYMQRLRRDIVKASRDKSRAPVLIFGEPGLEKDNIAALIHFGGPDHDKPMVQVNCDTLDESATLLYGMGRRRGLLYWLQDGGTLLLNNVHQANAAVMPLLKQVTLTRGSLDMPAGTYDDEDLTAQVEVRTGPRILLTEEKHVPELEALCTVIKVPPLRVRPADIKDLQRVFLRNFASARGMGDVVLTPEAVRRLESYSYPLNIKELEAMVERAATQNMGSGAQISEDVFWSAQQVTDRFRWNLLKAFPGFRNFLRSEWWPEKINFQFVAYAFAVVVAVLFVCPQDRQHNFALNAFWAYWWPVMFMIYPFVGRVWCAVCPFMIYGELVQKWRLSQGAKLLKWPREQAEAYGPWFLYALFYVILIWEEVWDLPNTAYLSSWLLLLITAGAVVGSWFFERRFWCRYLCPIGGMNGLFAKLSLTELRARQGVCSSTCTTYTCYKGGPAIPPEGQESVGCPIYSHPAQLVDNRNCVLCMECLKACPHKSVEFRLRPPGIELWTTHKPMAAEVALLMLLMGNVVLHHLPQLMTQFGLDPALAYSDRGHHILASIIALALPGMVCWAADWGWRSVQSATVVSPAAPELAPAGGSVPSDSEASDSPDSPEGVPKPRRYTGVATSSKLQKAALWGGGVGDRAMTATGAVQAVVPPAASKAVGKAIATLKNAMPAQQEPPLPQVQPFVEAAYGYLPLVWAGTLAHYLDLFLNEAGRILPVAAATFGVDAPWLPYVEAHPAVTTFLQGSTLVFGCALSLLLTRKIGGARYSWRQQAHQLALTVLITVELWGLIVGAGDPDLPTDLPINALSGSPLVGLWIHGPWW